jgi:polar amino acid transport system permease protein
VLDVLHGVPGTLLLTVLAYVAGAVLAIPVALARVSQSRVAWAASMSLIEVIRSIPPIVWIFIIYFGVSQYIELQSLTAAVIGLGIISAVYLAEIYRGGLMSVARGQWEASDALGMNRRATLTQIIAPQVVRVSIPAMASYGIGLLKDTSIAFTIGYAEIMYYATNDSQASTDPLTPFLGPV